MSPRTWGTAIRCGLRADLESPATWVAWDFTEAGQGDKRPRGPGEAGWGSVSRGWTVGPVPKDPNSLAQLLTGGAWAAWHTDWGLQEGMKAVWELSPMGAPGSKAKWQVSPCPGLPTGLVVYSLASLPLRPQPLTAMAWHLSRTTEPGLSNTHYAHSGASKLKSRRQQAVVALRALRKACVPGFSPRRVDGCLQVYMVPSLEKYLSPNSPFS